MTIASYFDIFVVDKFEIFGKRFTVHLVPARYE